MTFPFLKSLGIAGVAVLALSILAAEPSSKPGAVKPAVAIPLPVILPYLQNPAADAMTVCLAATGAQNVRVAWKAENETEFHETPAVPTPVSNTPWTVWKTRLAGLKPGGAYGYKMRYRLDGRETEEPPHTFRTIDPTATTFRAICVNDIHNREATLAALMKNVQPKDYEMAILNGDLWTNPSPAKGAEQVFRSLEAYVRLLNASDKPMLVVRGNHETIGGFAKQMACLFDLPNLDAKAKEFDQQWQFTLAAGPVWFLALDGGDDFTKRMESFQPLRQRQAEWIKEVLARHEGTGAWHLLLVHMPLYNDCCWNSEPCRQMWEPVLADANIDLELSGHHHQARHLIPKGKTYDIEFKGHYPDQQDPQQRQRFSFTTHWPVLISGGPALTGDQTCAFMLLDANAKKLSVKLLGADGQLFAEFRQERSNPTP